jgi:phosphoethanolamine N-methyltransferase
MASELANLITNELQSLLPEVTNKSVLAIVNGVENPTSYTNLLSDTQQLILFTESVDTYKQLDGQIKNSPILNCAKFNNAELQNNLFDVAFLIKSFNRLNIDEKQKILKNLLHTLKPNGQVFVYESEWTKDKENHSSNPVDVIHYFNSAENDKHGFELIYARPLRSYVEAKQESFHLCYIFKKIAKHDDHSTLQDFLDQQQYSTNGVLRYEKIFGPGFVSTGGLDTTKEFVESLNLKSDQLVLDVGCGIGGGDIYMAKTYGCSVIGVDLSTNMVSIAYERLMDMSASKLKVSFEIGDVMQHEFKANSFDVVYSRDTILHIVDKKTLFSRLYNWLKPGGQLFISDYTCAPKNEWSKEFEEYVNQRRYTLLTVADYGQVLESVGFKNVDAQDATDKFVACLKIELVRIESNKDDFIREFSSDDYQHLVEGWHSKLQRCAKGDQRWGILRARK